MDTEILKSNVFSFFMSLNPEEEESEVMFGGYDEDLIDPSYNDGTRELDIHPVLHQLFWSIKLDDIKIDGKSIGLCDILISIEKCLKIAVKSPKKTNKNFHKIIPPTFIEQGVPKTLRWGGSQITAYFWTGHINEEIPPDGT